MREITMRLSSTWLVWMFLMAMLLHECGCYDLYHFPGMDVMTMAPNDTILFIGDSQAFLGNAVRHGFLHVLQKEINSVFPDVKIVGTGKRKTSTSRIFHGFDGRVMGPDITKVIIMTGIDDLFLPLRANKEREWDERIESDEEDGMVDMTSSSLTEEEQRIVQFQYDLEAIMHRVQREARHGQMNITIGICSPLLLGDKIDGTNDYDTLIEEISGVIRQVSIDFQATFIDLRIQLMKFLETYNVENVPHSILTFDEYHLNEVGHRLVATALFQALGMDWRSLQGDPVLNGYDNHPSITKRHIKKSIEIDNDREAWGEEPHRPQEHERSQHGDGGEFMRMEESEPHHARQQTGYEEEEMNDRNEYHHMQQQHRQQQERGESDEEDDHNEHYRTHLVDEDIPETRGHRELHDDLRHIRDQDIHDNIEHDAEHLVTHTQQQGDEETFFEERFEEINGQEPWEEIEPLGMEMDLEDVEIIEEIDDTEFSSQYDEL